MFSPVSFAFLLSLFLLVFSLVPVSVSCYDLFPLVDDYLSPSHRHLPSSDRVQCPNSMESRNDFIDFNQNEASREFLCMNNSVAVKTVNFIVFISAVFGIGISSYRIWFDTGTTANTENLTRNNTRLNAHYRREGFSVMSLFRMGQSRNDSRIHPEISRIRAASEITQNRNRTFTTSRNTQNNRTNKTPNNNTTEHSRYESPAVAAARHRRANTHCVAVK